MDGIFVGHHGRTGASLSFSPLAVSRNVSRAISLLTQSQHGSGAFRFDGGCVDSGEEAGQSCAFE